MIKNVKVADLVSGPIRNELTPKQKARIKVIHEVFLEVFPATLEESFDDFRRDMHPDREIAIWESMAKTYLKRVKKCPTLASRQALLRTLLTGKQPAN